jgi:hypothetical protein
MLLQVLIAEGKIEPALIIPVLEHAIESEEILRETYKHLGDDHAYMKSVMVICQTRLLVAMLRSRSLESLP